MKTRNTCTIIRGVPGSGKTHLATAISASTGAKMFAADDYFIDEHGHYNYAKTFLSDAHQSCMDKCEQAMREGGGDVIVHNTFTMRWEMSKYIEMAERYGYNVVEITVRSNFENVHGVPKGTIERMKSRWEN
jgi:predicted kinase